MSSLQRFIADSSVAQCASSQAFVHAIKKKQDTGICGMHRIYTKGVFAEPIQPHPVDPVHPANPV
jgi:hypothetical protein